jgi:uncharacterized membrane protein
MTRIAIALVLLLCGCSQAGEAPQSNIVSNDLAAPAPETPAERQSGEEAAPPGAAAAGPCLVQDGVPVSANAIRAIGTEPFWGARVEGRCVTYSTPEDQDGTRIWTKFAGRAESGRWSGALDGQPFVMETRPQADCSDGMSDNVYPIAVTLTVRGEERRGCAEPL